MSSELFENLLNDAQKIDNEKVFEDQLKLTETKKPIKETKKPIREGTYMIKWIDEKDENKTSYVKADGEAQAVEAFKNSNFDVVNIERVVLVSKKWNPEDLHTDAGPNVCAECGEEIYPDPQGGLTRCEKCGYANRIVGIDED